MTEEQGNSIFQFSNLSLKIDLNNRLMTIFKLCCNNLGISTPVPEFVITAPSRPKAWNILINNAHDEKEGSVRSLTYALFETGSTALTNGFYMTAPDTETIKFNITDPDVKEGFQAYCKSVNIPDDTYTWSNEMFDEHYEELAYFLVEKANCCEDPFKEWVYTMEPVEETGVVFKINTKYKSSVDVNVNVNIDTEDKNDLNEEVNVESN